MREPNPKVDPASPAARIAAKFDKRGNPRASGLAKAIKRTPSTVQRWIENGHIDGQYHGEIVAAGRELSIEIGPDDFVDGRVFEKAGPIVCGICDRRADDVAVASCTAPDCGLAERRAA